jgi:hypothetical protein
MIEEVNGLTIASWPPKPISDPWERFDEMKTISSGECCFSLLTDYQRKE